MPRRYRVAAAIGAVALVLVLGYSGNLTAVHPVDRLLNPDARGYGESTEDYLMDVYAACGRETGVAEGRPGGVERLNRCLDRSVHTAIERGYLTEREAADEVIVIK